LQIAGQSSISALLKTNMHSVYLNFGTWVWLPPIINLSNEDDCLVKINIPTIRQDITD
jgi:hypothetical protein